MIMLFKTSSGASSFVLGALSSGNIEWRKEDGKVFKDVEDSDAEGGMRFGLPQ